jgi:predicted DNA-binding transcriptional regulator AlpA
MVSEDQDSVSNQALLAEFATKQQLAAEFGVSARTIERWVRMRLIPAPVRLGRKSLFHQPTIRAHLARQASESGAKRLRRT